MVGKISVRIKFYGDKMPLLYAVSNAGLKLQAKVRLTRTDLGCTSQVRMIRMLKANPDTVKVFNKLQMYLAVFIHLMLMFILWYNSKCLLMMLSEQLYQKLASLGHS